MRSLILGAGILALSVVQSAVAQQSHSPGTSQSPQHAATPGQAAAQNPAQIRQSIQHDLEQAGYTNVQVMPEAFLAHAKDKQGHPVTMVIEPGSVTAVTDLGKAGAPGGNPPQTSGGAGSSGTAQNH